MPHALPLKAARALATALLLCAGAPLRAQQPAPRGRIDGEVVDSIHLRPLAGALVMMTRLSPEPAESRTAVADAAGRFRFDSLAGGNYAIGFSAPEMDSLEVMMPPLQVALAIDEHQRVSLSTPSGQTLRAAACRGVTLATGHGAVLGAVTDADTEKPIPGATVVASWVDLALDTATLRAVTTPRVGAVRTDSSGYFRLCGVPTDTRILLQVQHAQRAGAVIDAYVDDTVRVAMRNISLSESGARPIVDSMPAASDTLPAPPLTGSATVSGAVRGEGGRPVAEARVTVEGARGLAVTDSLGRFTLSGLPAGTQTVDVHKLGYFVGRGQVELRNGRSTPWDIQLGRFVSLDSIRIIARRTRYREFARNKRSGFGRFYDEDEIARRNAFRTSDILRSTPGLRVQPSRDGFGDVVLSTRGSGWNSTCAMSVVIDGVQGEDINDIIPSEIGAMEVYPSATSAPPQYVRGDCGVIVIWTKR